MPASPIRKLVPYADAAKKRGVKVYHLNIGQPDIVTPQCALDAVRAYDGKVIEYSHSAGNLSYRKGLTEYYKSIGINITEDEIIVTNGGSEAITIAMMACLNPGDEIIIPEPFYTNYNSFALQAGVKVVPIKTTIANDFALPSIEDFEKIINPRTKAIMICNPNNPTGYLYSAAELETLRQIVLKYDLFLFADEVYREFCYDGNDHISCMTLKGLENNVVLMDSVSKRYSMCGVRVGAIISHNKERERPRELHSVRAKPSAPAVVTWHAHRRQTASTTYNFFIDIPHKNSPGRSKGSFPATCSTNTDVYCYARVQRF